MASEPETTKGGIPLLAAGAKKPKEGWALFVEGAREILSQWDLFKTAVVEEWGGRSSRTKFDHIVDDLVNNCEDQWKAGHDLHLDTLDVYLIECLTEDFNIDFEDDAVVTTISKLLQDLYRACAYGDLAGAHTLLDGLKHHPAMQPLGSRGRTASDDEGSDDGEGSEGGDDEDGEGGASGGGGAGGPKRIVDEDGWETIVTDRRGKAPKTVAPAPAASGGGAGDGSGAAPPSSAMEDA